MHQYTNLHDVIGQKTGLFLSTVVITTNLTFRVMIFVSDLLYILGVPKNIYTFYIITVEICSRTFAKKMALIK
jgi:hypothetical protein